MIRIFSIIALSIFALFSCQKAEEKHINIAVAANMQFAMKEIARSFSDKTGTEIQLMISSSGKLNAQIKEGAPYDIFVSADMKYPQDLYELGLTENQPQIYAYGKLVLWTMREHMEASLMALEDSNTRHIAIANPKIAPYGLAAQQVLTYYDLEESTKHKLVFGESISQCNQFILSKSAELGFTAKSVVLSPQMKNQGNWIEINAESYSPIAQGVVIIRHKNRKVDSAQNFYRFLLSKEAQDILIKFGYSVENIKRTTEVQGHSEKRIINKTKSRSKFAIQ